MRVYKSVKFKDKILQDLAEKRMIFLKVLSKKVKLLKNMYFTIEHNKLPIREKCKMYLPPKNHKIS